MRGGKREGAGRKPTEETVRISVPIGVLKQVQDLVEAYKQRQLEAGQVVEKLVALNERQRIKEKSPTNPEPIVPEPVQASEGLAPANDGYLNNSQEIKNAVKALGRLSSADRKVIRNSFGSFYEAAVLGVRAEGKNFTFPSHLKPMIKIPPNSRVSF